MSDSMAADTPKGEIPKPGRLGRPVMVIVLLGMVVLAVITLLINNGYGISGENTVSVETSDSVLAGKQNTVPAYNALSPSDQELLSSIPGLVTGQSELAVQVSSLTTSIDSSISRHSDFRSEMDSTLHDMNQTFNQLSRDAIDSQAQQTRLAQQLDAMSDSVLVLKKQMAQNLKLPSKAVIKKQSKPPFTLLSVQVWDSNPVAIVRHNNAQFGIGVNEKLSGWSINSILAPDCMEVSHQQQSVKLCL